MKLPWSKAFYHKKINSWEEGVCVGETGVFLRAGEELCGDKLIP